MTQTSDPTVSLEEIITSPEAAIRNLSLEVVCRDASSAALLSMCEDLERFRGQTDNLYYRVRGLFFLYAIHRFYLPGQLQGRESGRIPVSGHHHLLNRRFPEAIRDFLDSMRSDGPSITLSSGLATAYHQLALQTLADQVRKSVRSVKGNQWMFRTGHPADTPLRIRQELLQRSEQGEMPLLSEKTSVRMDFTHSAWSDIFFLGMDFPEGAQVINASVDLAVRGKHARPQPPIHCGLRVIDEPVFRLSSIDLGASTDVVTIPEMFDFAHDYLGLLKAAVIAAGLVPPGMEGCDTGLEGVLERLVGPGNGIEIVSRVNDIPKGSRLAVSTNLLGSLISLCMRATGQVSQFTGPLEEEDRRIVAARAILGEWIGGSGGGWQDSGGVWPGIKLIRGGLAREGDPEFGVSRGRLLPEHHVFDETEIPPQSRKLLQDSLVLVHGGMAQNVGPILEMVTEKYLLRSQAEWQARQEAIANVAKIQAALSAGDLRQVGKLTDHNFAEPLQRIIPWCSNQYTEKLIENCRKQYADKFWGFWMLGGMAGGGMGFLFDPECKSEASDWIANMMLETKRELQDSFPFAMDPVVYDFEINDQGTLAELTTAAGLPQGYYPLVLPGLLRREAHTLSPLRSLEMQRVAQLCQADSSHSVEASSPPLAQQLLGRILPSPLHAARTQPTLSSLLSENGFDPIAHQQLREDILDGRLGLPQNRLPSNSSIEDVGVEDVVDARETTHSALQAAAEAAIREGSVAVMTLAAGVGSRWTQGAGVCKALHPFHKMGGRHRSFLEVHLAKSRYVGEQFGCPPTHIFSTGYMTDGPIRGHLDRIEYAGRKVVSSGRSVGLRMVPTARDLRFAWEEMPQQVLDEQQEKVKQSGRAALLGWAKSQGEAADYVDNLPLQCMHPVGHWYEVPNLLRNGVLQTLLEQQPGLKHLMLHNVDTLGATLDPSTLALHMTSGACLSFEVITRRLEDRGGGLARVDGRPRLVEGLAMPNQDDEFQLSYYNSMTTWIHIDRLLDVFGLSREMLSDASLVENAIRRIGKRLPTYITLKDVKKRWGNGQEDIFPVCQFEKLWGDMTALPEVDCQFLVVPTLRGQQLKEQSQLDGWLREGSAAAIEKLCSW